MRMSRMSPCLLMGLVLGIVFMMVGQASAVTINTCGPAQTLSQCFVSFQETGETVNAYLNYTGSSSNSGAPALIASGTETVTVTVTMANTFINHPLPSGFSGYADLLEPGTGLVSDRVLFTPGANNTVTITFASDPATITLPANSILLGGGFEENGQLQQLIQDTSAGGSLATTLIISALSEPDELNSDVPEPASLLLLGSGLVGMGFFRRRRAGRREN